MPRILWQKAHFQEGRPNGWSGAPGEAEWLQDLAHRVDIKRQGLFDVVFSNGDYQIPGDTDATFKSRHPELNGAFDAVISAHYDANVYGQGGWFWDVANNDPRGPDSNRLGLLFQGYYEDIAGHPAFHPERRNANTSNYYLWRSVGQYPQLIVEHGIGAQGAPDFDWLRINLDNIANVWVNTIAKFLNLPISASNDPNYAVLGTSSLRFELLLKTLINTNPSADLTIPVLYRSLAPKAGIKAEVAFAQALKETDWFRFTGTAQADWYNPAGLGVAGPGVGNRFPSWEDGIRAHLGHLLWYYGPHIPEFCDKDQRHVGAHKNLVNDVRQMNNRWAVPGATYGEDIIKIVKG